LGKSKKSLESSKKAKDWRDDDRTIDLLQQKEGGRAPVALGLPHYADETCLT
jgi:hypothetical protein